MTCGPDRLQIHVSPDCDAHKCAGCTGDAWCDTTDGIVPCGHGCHRAAK